MADNTTPNRVPIPAPRSRIGIPKQQPPPSSHPPSPPSSHAPPFTPQSSHGAGPVRYIRPVTPQTQFSASLGGSNTVNTTPSYTQQISTPLPSSANTYQHPVTPANYRTLKEYSGPQKVMVPGPLNRHDNNDPHNHPAPIVTPRKDSWNSSRSSVSSEPPSPLRLMSEELSAEIEAKKEMKLGLLQEIDSLTHQKRTLVEEIDKERYELNELKQESEKCNQLVESLMAEENSIRRRLAQSEQNLQLMNRLSSSSTPSDLQREQMLKKRERELEENELTLEERSTKIRQTELDLQSQADVLFQRKKELDLREYDLKNFKGSASADKPVLSGAGGRYPDMLEHEERERKIQLKEDELFQRESHITDIEIELKRERDRLTQREHTVQDEENRVEQNLARAKEVMQEANKIKQEALDATKIAAILEDERKETKPTGPIRADDHRQTHHHQPGSGSRDTGNVQEVKQGGFNHTGGASGYSPSPYNAPTDTSFNSTDCADDLMVARLMNLEINKALAEEDARLAHQMSTMDTTKNNETEDADFQFAFQTQLDLMGIAPGSVGAEELKKQLQEAMDKEKKQNEAISRDSEIAASLTQSQS